MHNLIKQLYLKAAFVPVQRPSCTRICCFQRTSLNQLSRQTVQPYLMANLCLIKQVQKLSYLSQLFCSVTPIVNACIHLQCLHQYKTATCTKITYKKTCHTVCIAQQRLYKHFVFDISPGYINTNKKFIFHFLNKVTPCSAGYYHYKNLSQHFLVMISNITLIYSDAKIHICTTTPFLVFQHIEKVNLLSLSIWLWQKIKCAQRMQRSKWLP